MMSMKELIVKEDAINLLYESQDEITYFSFATEIRNFLIKLLENPTNAKASEKLREYFNSDDKHIIEKLIDVDLLRRKSGIEETPKEVTADGKSKVAFTVTYTVPKKGFKDKMMKLFHKTVLNETLLKKSELVEMMKNKNTLER